MTDLVVVQEVASNEVVLVFQPGGAVVITPPAAPPTVLIATPGGGGTDIVALPGQVIFANAAGDIVGSDKLRFIEDTYPIELPNWATLSLDGDLDATGSLYSNSNVDADGFGGGTFQIGVNNPAAPTPYYGLLSLYAYAVYADDGTLSEPEMGMLNIVARRDVFTVDPVTNVVTFPDPVIAKSITLTNPAYQGTVIAIPDSGSILKFGSSGSLNFGNPGPGDVMLGYGGYYPTLLTSGQGHPAGVCIASNAMFSFASIAQSYAVTDTGIARNTAGVVEINNGTLGQYRDLIVRDLFLGSPTTGVRLQDLGGSMRLVTAPISNYAFFTALGFAAAGGQYQCAAETGVVWSNANGTPGATKDIGLWRNAAGILEVNNASDKRVALRINTTQSSFDVVFDGVRRAQFGMGFRLGADCGFAWASNAAGNNSDNPLDTGFTRNAAGVIEINNGTPGQYRDLIARNITGSGGGVMGSYLRSFGSLQVDGYIFVPWQGPVTIAGGVVNFSGMNRTYDTEGGTATDDLDTINSGGDGVFMLLHAANDAHTIVVKHNTGNILLNGGVDFVLDNAADMLLLMYKGAISKWVQIASSNNGA